MDIAIIGGGAAGMFAGVVAAKENPALSITIFEKNDKLGKKVYATGNGRCNYTNEDMDPDHFHGLDPNFVKPGLKRFGRDETIKYFESLGITPWVEKDSGKYFPFSRQSRAVVEALERELKVLGVTVSLETAVTKLEKEQDFVIYTEDGKAHHAKKVIVATGGQALPDSGSDGNGYELVKPFKHSVGMVFPSIVQLKAQYPMAKRIDGTKFACRATLVVDGTELPWREGDILWTDYGLSGPPILDFSREANEAVLYGKDPLLRIALVPGTHQEVFSSLERRFKLMTERSVKDGLVGLVPEKLIPAVLRENQLQGEKSIKQLGAKELHRLAHGLTSWDFRITGSRDFTFAQATAGGVLTMDLDSETMESKLMPELYIVGELMDIDGDCGGYNLQWAWTSAYLAARHAANR